MVVPTFFCIGVLVWLGIMELRKWLEMFIKIGNTSDDENTEEIPDNVKHMYN